MSTLKVDSITNNGSAVDLTNGAFQIGGNDVVQGYTESATEPSSPTKGDLWWDTANELLYQYLNGEFKAIGVVVPALDVSAFSYDNISFSISETVLTSGLAFSVDGTKMYTANSGGDAIFQYGLTTAFDLSTASYSSKNFFAGSQEGSPRTVAFKDDGTVMYVVGRDNDTVYQYTLSTAWDVSSGSYASKSFSVSSQASNPNGLFFKPSGDRMYVVGYTSDAVHEYSLSTAWDVSTASFVSSFSVASQETSPMAVSFSEDGLKMIVSGNTTDSAHQYTLTTAWDVSTASYDNLSFSMASQTAAVNQGFLSADSSKFYTIDGGTNVVYQYSTNF